jgi:hypothetical protein
MTYKILWDNGHACGELSGQYTSEADAERAGRDWIRGMIAIEDTAKGRREARAAYSWEIIEEDDEAQEDDGAEESAWYEELNRGYARDRI